MNHSRETEAVVWGLANISINSKNQNGVSLVSSIRLCSGVAITNHQLGIRCAVTESIRYGHQLVVPWKGNQIVIVLTL